VSYFQSDEVRFAGAMTTGPDGKLWFVNDGGASVGRVTRSGHITTHAVAPGGSRDPTSGIALGPSGSLFVASRGLDALHELSIGLGPQCGAALPALFADVDAEHPFCSSIAWSDGEGIAVGYPDGRFLPTRFVSRQTLAALVHRMAGSPRGGKTTCALAPFADVATSSIFCTPIDWLVDEGIASGYADGSFRPDRAVSRQVIAAMLYRYAGSPAGPSPTCTVAPFTDVSVDDPFCGMIAWLVAEGVADGYPDGSFGPTRMVSRQAATAMLAALASLG
jgi:hypothetical protein